jgi:inner membrane protein
MLIKTHIAISVFVILLLVSKVEHQAAFVIVTLITSFIPDIDSRYSDLGRKKINRILQFFTKHRGITHSFVFLILVTLGLVFLIPVIALGFFLGYGLHLFVDSFTKEGITPFYPFSKTKASGGIATGGKVELGILFLFIIFDVFLFFVKFI